MWKLCWWDIVSIFYYFPSKSTTKQRILALMSHCWHNVPFLVTCPVRSCMFLTLECCIFHHLTKVTPVKKSLRIATSKGCVSTHYMCTQWVCIKRVGNINKAQPWLCCVTGSKVLPILKWQIGGDFVRCWSRLSRHITSFQFKLKMLCLQ